LILQVSAGARKYANHTYLVKLVEAAVEETDFLSACILTMVTASSFVNHVLTADLHPL